MQERPARGGLRALKLGRWPAKGELAQLVASKVRGLLLLVTEAVR